MLTRNVNLTEELDRFVLANNAREVVRDAPHALKRCEREYEAKLDALRTAIDEGDTSGIADGNVFGRVREKLNLPAAPK